MLPEAHMRLEWFETFEITPTRGEHRLGLTRPWDWGGSPFNAVQRMVDEMDRTPAAKGRRLEIAEGAKK
jgi:hypothetical protein